MRTGVILCGGEAKADFPSQRALWSSTKEPVKGQLINLKSYFIVLAFTEK